MNDEDNFELHSPSAGEPGYREPKAEINWGGQAFPSEGGHDSGLYPDAGMSLRDYFAGQALASIPTRSWDHVNGGDAAVIKAWGRCAYAFADAMLKARES